MAGATNTSPKSEIRSKYDRLARWYDAALFLLEKLALGAQRRLLLAQAEGRVLDVAAGTGANFRNYPPGVDLFAVDLSAGMLALARQRTGRLNRRVRLAVMDAESLAFPDAAFDTVVSSLAVCTYPDPVAALRELGRVCRPRGRILLLEHGRSSRPGLARWQDRTAEVHARLVCCHWNREPLELVRAAGLEVRQSTRRFLGILHVIEAAPAG